MELGADGTLIVADGMNRRITLFPAAEAGHCWQCGGIDWCKSTNFGMTECKAVALEYCETFGNFCN